MSNKSDAKIRMEQHLIRAFVSMAEESLPPDDFAELTHSMVPKIYKARSLWSKAEGSE